MIDASELSRKLQIGPDTRIRMWDVPDRYVRALAAAGFAERATRGESYDGALVFCENPQGVAAVVTKVLEGLPADGMLWFAYRKGKAGESVGLTRDKGWEPLNAAGYRVVRAIAIDETWTGLRFRLYDKVKSAGTT